VKTGVNALIASEDGRNRPDDAALRPGHAIDSVIPQPGLLQASAQKTILASDPAAVGAPKVK
jgi:hypothetical protein